MVRNCQVSVVVDKLTKLTGKVIGQTRKEVKKIARKAMDAIQIGAFGLKYLNHRH